MKPCKCLFVLILLLLFLVPQLGMIRCSYENKGHQVKQDGTILLWEQQQEFLKTKHKIIENIYINNNFYQKICNPEPKVIFSILDGPYLEEYKKVSSTLQGNGKHCCVYVADSEWRGVGPDNTGITNQDVEQIIDTFDNTIYPIETEYFREMPDYGFGDRVTILLVDIEDGYPHSSGWIGGYFYFYNYLPMEQFPDSNERHMIVIDTNPTIVNNPNNGFAKTLEEGLATIAHEYQHLLHFWSDPYETTWLNEGLSDYAEYITLGNIPVDHLAYFLAFHSVNLEEWGSGDVHTVENYGAAFLYMLYLDENFGGYRIIRDIHNDGVTQGRESISKHLKQFGTTFEDVFTDWTLANLLDNPSLKGDNSNSALGYYNLDIPSDNTDNLSVINFLWHGLNWDYGPFPLQEQYRDMDGMYPTPDQGYWEDSQHQLDANYFKYLASETPSVLKFNFFGNGFDAGQVYLVKPSKGNVAWYSGRDNHLNSGNEHTLSHVFDFSLLSSPCMKIDTWYDIEHGYDFGYVEISTDNGATWSQLDDTGDVMTNYRASNSIGHDSYAFTGQSISWMHDVTFDLSDYAGISSVIMRFVYLTDPMQTGEGWVVDNIRIIDGDILFCNGSDTSDSSWATDGWEQSDTSYNLEWTVYLIGYPYEGPPLQDDIYKMDLNSETQDGTISIRGLGSVYRQFVVVPSLIIKNNITREFGYMHTGWIEIFDRGVPNTFPLYNSAQLKVNDALKNMRNSIEETNILSLDGTEFEKTMNIIAELVEEASFGVNYVYRANRLNKALSILSELLSQL